MKWSNLTLSFAVGFLSLGVTAVQAQPSSAPPPALHRASFVHRISPAGLVHISATTMAGNSSSIDVADDRWVARGCDLKSLLAEIFEVDPRRIDLPEDGTEARRFDVTLMLPKDATEETTQRLLQQALEDRFHLTITPESRSVEVYVITAPNGAGRELHPHQFAQNAPDDLALADVPRFTYSGRACPGISTGGISATSGSISEFRRTLEPNLDRLLVNETQLDGSYDFQIGEYGSRDELFQLLRDRLGLVVTPAQRQVTVLNVRPASSREQASGSL